MLELMRDNPTHEPISDTILQEDGRIARRYTSGDHDTIFYGVYHPIQSTQGRHSHIIHIPEYGWLEEITTQAVPAEIEALPRRSEARRVAADRYYATLKAEAERIIRATFPQDSLQKED